MPTLCSITSLVRFRSHYPGWAITKPLDDIFRELVEGWRHRIGA